MREIKGSYVHEKKEVKFETSIPGNWGELDKYQYSRIRELLTFTKADKYTIAVSLLSLLFGPKNFHILNGLDDELRFELLPLINFIHEEKPPLINFFPKLKINRKEHVSPAEDLSNIGFGEWCFAHQFYIYYVTTRDEAWLNSLVATLYRPLDPSKSETSSDYNGDLRADFNENVLEKAVKSVAAIEFHIKLGVFSWFSIAVEKIADARPHVFPPVPEGVEEEPREMPDKPNENWLTVFRSLLGPKFGTERQLKFTNAMFVLDYLEEQRIDYEKALAKK